MLLSLPTSAAPRSPSAPLPSRVIDGPPSLYDDTKDAESRGSAEAHSLCDDVQ